MNIRNGLFAVIIAVITVFSAADATAPGALAAGRGDTMHTLKIMTINVWSGLDYIGTLKMGEYESKEVRESRYRALVAEIKTLDPDVIGVNEANLLPDYVERLAKDLGYDYIYHVGVSGLHVWRIGMPWNLKEGDALLARKGLGLKLAGRMQLSGGGFIRNNLSFHTQDATQVLLGKIRVNSKDIYVAVTHWHAWPCDNARNRILLAELKMKWNYSADDYHAAVESLEKDNRWRMDESRLMGGYLKKTIPSGAPLIVMGDFNSDIGWPELDAFIGNGYIDTYRAVNRDAGYTWDPELNLNFRKYYKQDLGRKFDTVYEHLIKITDAERRRIDYIFINDVMKKDSVLESKVCANKESGGVHPSDHFGVMSVVRID
jgi:endonuclease/exonuclease/phosphatase family metal-dependent hydrolase